jgi:hypothetical protein
MIRQHLPSNISTLFMALVAFGTFLAQFHVPGRPMGKPRWPHHSACALIDVKLIWGRNGGRLNHTGSDRRNAQGPGLRNLFAHGREVPDPAFRANWLLWPVLELALASFPICIAVLKLFAAASKDGRGRDGYCSPGSWSQRNECFERTLLFAEGSSYPPPPVDAFSRRTQSPPNA